MRTVLLAIATLLTSTSVSAQAPWFALPVPKAAFGPLKIDLKISPSLALDRAVRVLHALPREGDGPPQVVEFEHLLGTLDAFEQEAQRLGQRGLSLAMSRNSSERDVLQDVLKMLGFRLRERRGTYTVEADRDSDAVALRKLLASAGIDTETLETRLNEGETLTLAPEVVLMPSPLPPEVWASVVFERAIPPRSLFSAIARDRRAALLLVGLKAMGSDARAYLAKDRELLRRLYSDSAGAVAAFGEILHLNAAGSLVLPGGRDATPLWEGLVDERIERVDRFVRALFEHDSGRLAFFVHTLAHLDEAHLKFALGLWISDRATRLDRFRALYRTFVDVDPNWSVATLPFARPLYDPAMLLHLVGVDQTGTPAAPNFRRFWDKALDGIDLPAPGARELGDPAQDGLADAAWLAEHTRRDLFPERRLLSERVAFGQRVFGRVAGGELEDALAALRGFGRFPALMIALERIGIHNPAVYAGAARRARELEDVTDPVLAVPLLAQFQGALALLQRLGRTEALDVTKREALVGSLVAIPIIESRYSGALVGWLTTDLMPALGPPAGADHPLEDAILRGFAERGEIRSFDWEGTRYTADVTTHSLRDLTAIRAKQGGNSLDDIVALWKVTRALEQPKLPLDDIKRDTATLKAAGARIMPLRQWPELSDEPADFKKALERAVRDLSRLSKPKDTEKAPRAVRNVARLVDELLAETLVALAYTPWLGDPAALLGPQADVSHRHNFGLRASAGPVVERAAWQRTAPKSSAVAGGSFGGSLLSLDLVRAGKRLRRLAADAAPRAPQLNPNDSEAMTETLALRNPRDLTTADLDTIGQAVARGRALVRGARESDALDALAGRTPMPGSRRQELSWAKQTNPERVDRLFSVNELLRLGLGEDSAPRLDPWGATAEPTSGCLCLRFPDPGAWEVLAGRPGGRLLGAAVPDVTLRAMEHLAAIGVPAALAPDVVAFATQEFIDSAPALYHDDWVGVVAHAHELTQDMVEDYVAAVVASGPVRAAAAGEAAR